MKNVSLWWFGGFQALQAARQRPSRDLKISPTTPTMMYETTLLELTNAQFISPFHTNCTTHTRLSKQPWNRCSIENSKPAYFASYFSLKGRTKPKQAYILTASLWTSTVLKMTFSCKTVHFFLLILNTHNLKSIIDEKKVEFCLIFLCFTLW